MFYHVPHAMDNIAAWYDNAPVIGDKSYAWHTLASESTAQVNRLLNGPYAGLEILRVTGQPYDSYLDMFDDIDKGILLVSTDNSFHPIFTLEQNIEFRIWHDLAHREAYANFTYKGEVETYNKQLEHIVDFSDGIYRDLRHALFVEVLGQAASMIVNGKFNVQKVF